MRLYNAKSCTPMATSSIKATPSFPPKGFLPSPKKKRPIQRSEIKRAVLDRYQQGNNIAARCDLNTGSSRRDPAGNSFARDVLVEQQQRPTMLECRDDVETRRVLGQSDDWGRDKETEPRSDLETNSEECRECSLEPEPPASVNVVSTEEREDVPPRGLALACKTIPESLPLVDGEKRVENCFPSLSHKTKAATKTKKRNSAFHSPLRIAKYSFHSPPPQSQRTLSTDSTLDLVFSPSDSPGISKNETSTTAATSELDHVRSDASGSFLFDIEVVKSDSDTPAKMLGTGSVISKSSSSTLTSKLATERPTIDELEHGNHDRRSLFSPIPWTPGRHEIERPAPTLVEKKKLLTFGLTWSEESNEGFVEKQRSVFESAWLEEKRRVSDGFSEEDSWIDFTNDPFKSHSLTSLERPFPTKTDNSALGPKTETALGWPIDGGFKSDGNQEDGFIIKKTSENRTMETFSSRQSNSGASEISFPSISAGGNTWSQAGSLDERDSEPRSTWKSNSVCPPSSTQTGPVTGHCTSRRLLGSILQERFQANLKSSHAKRGRSVPFKSMKALTVDKPPTLRSSSKPPLQPNRPEEPKLTGQKTENESCGVSITPTIEIAKYVKMLGMGVPADAVKNAMARDGVDVSLLFRPKTSSKEQQTNPTYVRSDKVRHFRIHWETHEHVGANTLWSKLKRDEPWLEKTIRVDENEFSLMFRQEQKPFCPPQVKGSASSLVRVIDPKRANNGGIALSQIKLSYEHTAQAIDRLDNTVLCLDQMKAILPFIPTSEEAIKLRQSLRSSVTRNWFRCECEKFMVAMLRVSDAEEKLRHMIFMSTFPDLSEDLKKDAILVQRACQEVMSSQNFRRVLALILSLGNRVNNQASGNALHSAAAITLGSLITLNQSKTFDRQTTFLQYAASLLRKYAPETIDWKQEDMPSLRRAHKVKWKLWLAEFELMKGKLNSLRARCLQNPQALRPGGTTSNTAARVSSPIWQFVCQAEAKFAALKEEGDKGTHALESLWQYFGENSSNASRCDSVLGTLVLFGHQWEQAVEHVVRLERESRRKPKLASSETCEESLALSPASSKASQHSPFLSASQSYGHDV